MRLREQPRAILAAAWLAAFVVGFPGRLPAASVELLQHARAPHPTVFSFVWHLLEYVLAGPSGMLVAQVTLAIAGVYAILKAALPAVRAAWLTAVVILCPPVLATLTIVSPGALAGALLLFGAGRLVVGREVAGTRLAIAAVGLAAAVHPAAILAALPLLLLAEKPVRAVVVWVAIAAVAIGANAALTRHAPHFHAHVDVLRAPATIDPPTAPDDVLLKLGIPTERSHLQDAVTWVLDLVPLLYAPWLWLAAAIGLLALRRDGSARLLVAAGIGFAVGLVIAPDLALPLYAFVLVAFVRGHAGLDPVREKRV